MAIKTSEQQHICKLEYNPYICRNQNNLLMKSILFFTCFLLAEFGWTQTANGTITTKVLVSSPLTKTMMEKDYSADRIKEMKAHSPNKIRTLDYYYSKSFKVKANQKHTPAQLLKINVHNLDKLRLSEKKKEVFDKASKLYLILDSFQTMKAKMKQLMSINPSSTIQPLSKQL